MKSGLRDQENGLGEPDGDGSGQPRPGPGGQEAHRGRPSGRHAARRPTAPDAAMRGTGPGLVSRWRNTQ